MGERRRPGEPGVVNIRLFTPMTKWCLCHLAETAHLPLLSLLRCCQGDWQRRSASLQEVWFSSGMHCSLQPQPSPPPRPPTAKGVIPPASGYCHIGWWVTFPQQLVANVLLLSTVREHFQDLPFTPPRRPHLHPPKHFDPPFSASCLERASHPHTSRTGVSLVQNCTQITAPSAF